MGANVYANGNAIACKAGSAKVIAAFPDVCLSPPSPPAGPVPIPYPDTSFSKDMKKGSKTVKIKKKEVMLKDKSFYKTSPLGNEAATKSLGAGVVSHVITGKTYFVMWSMDVKFEGKNVDRHCDLTTSNHASPMANSAPKDNADKKAKKDEGPKCPCCGDNAHANQIDPDTENLYPQIDEMEFYERIANYYIARRKMLQDILGGPNPAKGIKKFNLTPEKMANIDKMGDEAEEDLKTLKEKRGSATHCDNVHNPPDEKCGKHLKNTKGGADEARKEYTSGHQTASRKEYINKGYTVPVNNTDYAHKTPLDAGGCPKDIKNLIPNPVIKQQGEDCEAIENAQTRLQNRLPNHDRSIVFG